MKRWAHRIVIVEIALALIVGFAAVGADTRASAATAPDGLAQVVVVGYYDAINDGQYALAYSYLGSAWHAWQSYSSFVNGFVNTSFDDVMVTSYYDGANASTVYVNLAAYQIDGSVQYYLGTYSLAYEGMYFKIIDANIKAN